ncbi:MAG: hypothetical protein RLZZ387_2711 [Chloroflexota bacterium]|jgi:sugar phosphate isomerase/epimerase
MHIHGYASNLYGWFERAKLDGRPVSLTDIVRDCREAGLDAVEINAGPEMAQGCAEARAAGLRVSGSYLGLPLHGPWESLDAERAILPHARTLAAAGGTDFLVNADPKGGWAARLDKTEDELRRQGENLTRLADLVAAEGVRLCFHNHCAAYAQSEGDLRSAVEYGGPQVLLCVDTGWAHTSGCDALAWVRAYPERVGALHLRNQRGPVPTEDLLEGEVDIAGLVALLTEIGYAGWLAMELWHRADTGATRSMVEDTRRSIAYLKELVAS